MIKRILSFLLVLSMLLAISPSTAHAATLDELNEAQMFEKQIGSGKCTLATAAMLVKRTARALGQTGWENINSDAVRSTVWIEGTGLRQSFTYNGIKYDSINCYPDNFPVKKFKDEFDIACESDGAPPKLYYNILLDDKSCGLEMACEILNKICDNIEEQKAKEKKNKLEGF